MIVPPANHGRRSRASASRRASRQPDPGRQAEHLVPADRHELGLDDRQVKAAGGDERGRVEQHVVPGRLRPRHPRERMAHPAEVGLGRVGEQPRPRSVPAADRGQHVGLAHTQLAALPVAALPVAALEADVGHPGAAAGGAVLYAIASGATKYSEIQDAAGFPPARGIDRLQEARLITRVTPVGQDPDKSRRAIYRIADNFLAFYLGPLRK
jgi:hypothetical protein